MAQPLVPVASRSKPTPPSQRWCWFSCKSSWTCICWRQHWGSPVPLNLTIQVMSVLRTVLHYWWGWKKKKRIPSSQLQFSNSRGSNLETPGFPDKLGQKGSCCFLSGESPWQRTERDSCFKHCLLLLSGNRAGKTRAHQGENQELGLGSKCEQVRG